MTDIHAAAGEAQTVRKATWDALPRLAAVLARAFYDTLGKGSPPLWRMWREPVG